MQTPIMPPPIMTMLEDGSVAMIGGSLIQSRWIPGGLCVFLALVNSKVTLLLCSNLVVLSLNYSTN